MTSGTGTCTVKVNRLGESNYNEATEVSASATATKINQAALTLTGVPGDGSIPIELYGPPGGGSSSDPLVLSTAGVCSVAGNQVTMNSGTGTCTVKVNRAGDSNYNDASEVSASATGDQDQSSGADAHQVCPGTAAYIELYSHTGRRQQLQSAGVEHGSGVCSVGRQRHHDDQRHGYLHGESEPSG